MYSVCFSNLRARFSVLFLTFFNSFSRAICHEEILVLSFCERIKRLVTLSIILVDYCNSNFHYSDICSFVHVLRSTHTKKRAQGIADRRSWHIGSDSFSIGLYDEQIQYKFKPHKAGSRKSWVMAINFSSKSFYHYWDFQIYHPAVFMIHWISLSETNCNIICWYFHELW